MSHYLMKYKGTYRVKPELDVNTHDIPRDANGDIADGWDDLYIDCRYGNKIYMYGHDVNKRAILSAYIPSIGRGRNIRKALEKDNITYTDYIETNSEVIFNFKAKDISVIANLLNLNDPPKMVHRSTYEDIPVEGLSNLADKGSRQELALDEALEKFDIGDFQRLIYEGKVNKKPIGYFNAVIMTMVDSCKEGE